MNLERISLIQDSITKGTDPDQLHLAVYLDPKGRISENRPTLSGKFEVVEPGKDRPAPPDREVVLRGRLDVDRAAVLSISISIMKDPEQARLVDPRTEKETDLGLRSRVQLVVTRDNNAPPSESARILAAKLWSLVGENVKAPSAPARFEAAVLGTRLVNNDSPATFGSPGKGTWILLKTINPEEIYFAFDIDSGVGQFFPNTEFEANDAARALFDAL